MKQALFIPCYNCDKQIARMFDDLSSIGENIYFIDNKSNDQTFTTIRQFCAKNPNSMLLAHKENYGLGGSFKTAIKFAQENNLEWVIWLHGDDQAKVSDLSLFFSEIEKNEVDAIFGSRFMPQSKRYNYSLVRTFGNVVLNKFAGLFLKNPVFELGSGLNAYRTSSLKNLEVELWPNHIAFDMNLLIHFVSSTRYKFVPIEWHELDQVSNARNFKVAFDVIKMLWRWRCTKKLDTSINNVQQRSYDVEA